MVITDDVSLEGARIRVLDIPNRILWANRKNEFIDRTGTLVKGILSRDRPIVYVFFDEPAPSLPHLYFEKLDVEFLTGPTNDPDLNY